MTKLEEITQKQYYNQCERLGICTQNDYIKIIDDIAQKAVNWEEKQQKKLMGGTIGEDIQEELC